MARHPIFSRICAGEYKMVYGDYVVSISRFDHLDNKYGTWVVRAEWSMSIYSDPIYYLADAKQCAKEMIDEACNKHKKPLGR